MGLWTGVIIEEGSPKASAIERVKIKDGYLIEGRRDGVVGGYSRWKNLGMNAPAVMEPVQNEVAQASD